MKQLVYHIIVCGMAVLFLTACEKDDDISGRSMEKTGNSLILNLSSETLPVSRAGNDPGVEMAVNHIDVVKLHRRKFRLIHPLLLQALFRL